MPTDYTPDITQNPAVMQMLQQLTQGQAPPPSPGLDLQALMQRAAQVPPQTLPVDPNVPDKADWGSKIILGLADAMQAYAHGRNPNVPVNNFTAHLYEKIRQNRLTKAENERRTGEAKIASERNLAGLQLEKIGREDAAIRAGKERANQEETIALRSAVNDARDLGVDISPNDTSASLSSKVAAKRRDLQTEAEKKAARHEASARYDGLARAAAENRVKLPPELQKAAQEGDPTAYAQGWDLIARRPEAVRPKDEADLRQAMSAGRSVALDLIDGDPGNPSKGIPAQPSISEMAQKGVPWEQIQNRFRKSLDRMVLPVEARKDAEEYFMSNAYPEYQKAALELQLSQMGPVYPTETSPEIRNQINMNAATARRGP